MPWSERGACKLRAALDDVDEQPEHPVTVWWWDDVARDIRRGTVYGWRGSGSGREALVVARRLECPADDDCVRWVPEHLTNERRGA